MARQIVMNSFRNNNELLKDQQIQVYKSREMQQQLLSLSLFMSSYGRLAVMSV